MIMKVYIHINNFFMNILNNVKRMKYRILFGL